MLEGDYAGVDAVTRGWGFGLPDLMHDGQLHAHEANDSKEGTKAQEK